MKSKKSHNINYECVHCNYVTKSKKDYNKHSLTKKHKMNIGEIKKIPKIFLCGFCNKKFNNNTSLWRHKKSCNLKNYKSPKVSESLQKVSAKYLCICGKKYKSRSGFYKHKKTCSILNNVNEKNQDNNNNNNNNNNNLYTTNVEKLLQNILHENKVLRDKLSNLEMNVTNITNNNTNNNQFNINMFLNEKCKNAMNLEDFIQKIKFTLEDLKYTKDNGYTKGISNVFIKSLNDMDVTERPIHCSDRKRLQFYVKNDNEWTKDKNNEKIDNTIEKVSRKQIKSIQEWVEANPDYTESDSKMEEYFTLVRSITQPNDNKNLKNIKRKVGENVKLGKVND